MSTVNPQDQTQFIEDQVLWQETATTPSASPEVAEVTSVLPLKKKPNMKLILAAAGGGCAVLLILLMMVAGMGRNSLLLVPEPSPSPTPSAVNKTEFDKAFERLQRDIKIADPSVNELPFPPVNPSLYIIQNQ